MSTILEIRDLSKTYPAPNGAGVRALDRVNLSLREGEVLGIVGESGCGKSTLGRALLRLIEPSGGQVLFEGDDLVTLGARELKRRRRDLQIIFQDPFGSLNPRHRVGDIVREPLDVHRVGDRRSRSERVRELIEMVGLPPDAVSRYPHEFSGGQRQRISIARALALNPKLIVADEPVSALDVSIQSQVINLIVELRERFGLSMLFISHDLSVIRHVSDRIAVMYLGRIVEIGEAGDLMEKPLHPYTRALLSAIPRPSAEGRRKRTVLKGELPDPANPPSGCAFRTRCPHAMPICAAEVPALAMRQDEDVRRETACHLYPSHAS
jgi:peptide/nickel transport system ATP-binding protein/oligopeptide transport system ATP-binding protein